jgi:hypothetical protein
LKKEIQRYNLHREYEERTRQILRENYPDIEKQAFYVYSGKDSGFDFYSDSTKRIVSNINTAISNGFKTVIFDTIYEAVYFDIIQKIHTIIDTINKPNITYFYLCSAQNASEAYCTHCKENNISELLKMLPISIFELTTKEYLINFYHYNRYPVIKYKKGIKSKLFNCFNKELREHRIRIFYNILKNQLLDKTYSSFYYGKEVINGDYNKRIKKVYRAYEFIFPRMLNASKIRYNPVDVQIGDLKYHADSYFSLVTETLFFKHSIDTGESDAGKSIFLSEKTFRPIIHKHPFILVSSAESLVYLKKLGYKTFSPYINEHYDTIKNDEERLTAVWSEVERLCAFSDEEWLEWQNGIIDIVEHNYNVLINKTNYAIL